jgi:uncharacterized protein GlcG (DUF336 family)
MRRIAYALSLMVFALFAAQAVAQPRPPYTTPVSLETAKKAAAAAVAESKKHGWRMAIAIVDNHGFLIYYEMMDDTQTASSSIAIEKARTAAMLRRPTKAVEDGINKGRVSLLTLGVMSLEGGLPIMVNGRVAGGIGVSGANSDEDAKAAQAGLDAIGSK